MNHLNKILIILCATLIVLSNTVPTNAKVKVINKRLYANNVYKSYDITGDNKKDRIALKRDITGYNEYGDPIYKQLSIYINKKLAYRIKDTTDIVDFENPDLYAVRYIRLANNKKFIYINYDCKWERRTDSYLLAYKNKKLKKVTKYLWSLPGLSSNQTLRYSEGDVSTNGIQIKNNSIIVSNTTFLTSFISDYLYYKVTYTYKNGKFYQSKSGSVTGIYRWDEGTEQKYRYTANTLQVYKDTKFKKKAFKIKANKKVVISRIGGAYNYYWAKIKYGKKVGYVKVPKLSYYHNTYQTKFYDIY